MKKHDFEAIYPTLIPTSLIQKGGQQQRGFQFIVLGVLWLLCGCRALNPPDTAATLAAQNAAYSTEIAQIEANTASQRASVEQTVSAQATQVLILNGVNEQLLATLSVQVTPTPFLAGEAAPDDLGIVVQRSSDGTLPVGISGRTSGTSPNNPNSPYTPTGVSARVRQADGCVQNPQSNFTLDTARIYVTLVANNLQAGTLMGATWYRAEQLLVEQSWRADRNYEQLCVWFYIDSSDVVFTPGSWSVRLSANGQPISGAIGFTIGDS